MLVPAAAVSDFLNHPNHPLLRHLICVFLYKLPIFCMNEMIISFVSMVLMLVNN